MTMRYNYHISHLYLINNFRYWLYAWNFYVLFSKDRRIFGYLKLWYSKEISNIRIFNDTRLFSPSKGCIELKTDVILITNIFNTLYAWISKSIPKNSHPFFNYRFLFLFILAHMLKPHKHPQVSFGKLCFHSFFQFSKLHQTQQLLFVLFVYSFPLFSVSILFQIGDEAKGIIRVRIFHSDIMYNTATNHEVPNYIFIY